MYIVVIGLVDSRKITFGKIEDNFLNRHLSIISKN